MRSHILILLLMTPLIWLASGAVWAQKAECSDDDSPCASAKRDEAEAEGWIDNSHIYLSTRADRLVQWVDNFFGAERTDLESADSILRLRLENEWEEDDDNNIGVRLRGKIHLPRLNERIDLLFSDEEGPNDGSSEIDEAIRDRDRSNSVALQYNSLDRGRSRIDLRLGLRSGAKVRVGARYRYTLPFLDHSLLRNTQELFFRDGAEGFGLESRLDLDNAVDESTLFRWSNALTYGENTFGAEWNSGLSLAHRIDEKQAVSAFANINGQTNPGYLTRSYGAGILYRRNIWRRWLFIEAEPAYVWRRKQVDEDDLPLNFPDRDAQFFPRKGSAIFTLRLEVVLDRDNITF